jgi:hypothetical protein
MAARSDCFQTYFEVPVRSSFPNPLEEFACYLLDPGPRFKRVLGRKKKRAGQKIVRDWRSQKFWDAESTSRRPGQSISNPVSDLQVLPRWLAFVSEPF